MRTSGMMEYITPRHRATESSTTPKSVMKTMVCGYFADCALVSVAETSSSTITNPDRRSCLRRDEALARTGLSFVVIMVDRILGSPPRRKSCADLMALRLQERIRLASLGKTAESLP